MSERRGLSFKDVCIFPAVPGSPDFTSINITPEQASERIRSSQEELFAKLTERHGFGAIVPDRLFITDEINYPEPAQIDSLRHVHDIVMHQGQPRTLPEALGILVSVALDPEHVS